MTVNSVETFIDGLIRKTRNQELDWKPLLMLSNWGDIKAELVKGAVSIDFGFNTVRVSNSYYLQSGSGYVFLFEIYHGLPEVTSPELDTVALMVKVNEYLSIDNLSKFTEDEQEKLRTLQLLIESGVEEKYSYMDILYSFFQQVLDE